MNHFSHISVNFILLFRSSHIRLLGVNTCLEVNQDYIKKLEEERFSADLKKAQTSRGLVAVITEPNITPSHTAPTPKQGPNQPQSKVIRSLFGCSVRWGGGRMAAGSIRPYELGFKHQHQPRLPNEGFHTVAFMGLKYGRLICAISCFFLAWVEVQAWALLLR